MNEIEDCNTAAADVSVQGAITSGRRQMYEQWWSWALEASDAVSEVVSAGRSWAIICADAEQPLPGLRPESIDAVITDPPAGIKFMGREWDSDKGGEEQWIAWLSRCLAHAFAALKPGGHAIVWALPRTSDWTAQALRRAGFEIRDVFSHCFATGYPKSLSVSKAIDSHLGAERPVVGSWSMPGRGSRSQEQAYGLTKDIGTITAAATPEAKRWEGYGTSLKPAHERWFIAQKGFVARPFGRVEKVTGSRLGISSEDWIVARKPLIGTVAENVLAHGTGGINIDAGRVGSFGGGTDCNYWPGECKGHGNAGRSTSGETRHGAPPEGWPNVGSGRWPANFVLSHASWDETVCACGLVLHCVVRFCPACGSGDLKHRRGGCRRVGERRVRGSHDTTGVWGSRDSLVFGGGFTGVESKDRKNFYTDPDGTESVDAWECLATCDACGCSWLAPEGGSAPLCGCGQQGRWACAVAVLDEQSGERTSGSRAAGVRTSLGYGGAGGDGGPAIESSAGNASRFFHCFAPDSIEPFFFSAKPSTSETEAGCDALTKSPARGALNTKNGIGERLDGRPTPVRANVHPTKKSMALIGHFCDLFLPSGGIALDLFGGSGTLAAVVAHRHHVTGWRAILTEISPEYVEIGRARAKHWGARPWRPKRVPTVKKTAHAAQPSLFRDPP